MFALINCLHLNAPYLFDVCSENKGCCAPTKNTVLFPISKIGPRSPPLIALHSSYQSEKRRKVAPRIKASSFHKPPVHGTTTKRR